MSVLVYVCSSPFVSQMFKVYFESSTYVYFLLDFDFCWTKSFITTKSDKFCILKLSIACVLEGPYLSDLVIGLHTTNSVR